MTANTSCPGLDELELATPATQAHVANCASCQAVGALIDRRRARLAEGPCVRFETLIALAESEPLSADEAEALEAHLGACDACHSIAKSKAPLDALLSDHSDLPTVGRDAYVVGEEIAHGGMGRVLEARDRRIGRSVALKEMLDASPGMAARFEREARLTARLQHPGIVSIYEIGRWPEGRPFYVMPRLPGRTLREAIQKARTRDERMALLPLVIAATEAVAYAHSRRIIHRDLTPSNILLGLFGETVVIDWGLARDLDAGAEDTEGEASPPTSGDLTRAGAVLGTAAYMPPEQAAAQPVDERGDVYALGAILYHLLCGQPPFRGATTDAILEQVRRGPPSPLNGPPDLVAIVTRAMSREPAGRYASARELAEELNRFVAGQLVSARDYSLVQLLKRWIAKHRAVVTTCAVSLLVLLALAAWGNRRIVQERDRALAANAALLADEGRHELLSGSPARALPYLSAAYSAGVDDSATRYLLHVAMRNLEALTLSTEGRLDRGDSHVFSADRSRVVVQREGRVDVLDALDAGVLLSLPHEEGARFTPDGHLVTRGQGVVRLRDGQKGDVLRTFEHPGGVDAFEVSDDGRRLLTTSKAAESARVFDLASGKLLLQKQAAVPTLHVLRSELSSDGRLLATSARDETAQVWSVDDGTQVLSLPSHVLLAWDPKATRLLAELPDGALAIVDAKTGTPLRRLAEEAGGALGSAAFNATGTHVRATLADGMLRLWETGTGRLVGTYGQGSFMTFGVFDPAGERLAAYGNGPVVRLYSVRHGGLVATWEGHTQSTNAAVFSDDGSKLLTAEDSGPLGQGRVSAEPSRLQLWDTAATGETAIRSEVPLPIAQDTTRRLVTLTDDKRLLVWEMESGKLARDLGKVGALAVAQLADRMMVARPDSRTGEVLDVNTFERRCTFEAAAPVRGASVSARGDTLITWSWEAAPELWDGATCRRLAQLDLPQGALSLELNRSGGRFVVQREVDQAELWDVQSARRIAMLGTRFDLLVWSADERWFLTSHFLSGNPRAEVFDAATGTPRYALPQPFLLGLLSDDGNLIASPRMNGGGVVLRDTATGRALSILPGDPTGTALADFSPDQQLVVTSENSDVARVWDVRTTRQLDEFGLPRPQRTVVAPRHGIQGRFSKADSFAIFSADRRHLLGIGAGGSLVVYDFALEQRSPEVIARFAKARVPWSLVEGRLVSTQTLPVAPVTSSSVVSGAITGRITHGGMPVMQAEVRARRIGGGEPGVTATAADGTFTLELPPGRYGVRVTAWTPRWYGIGPTVEVKAGERVSADVDLTLGPSISGQLVDEKGGPVPGPSACFVAAGEEACGGADEQGFFAVYGLAGGKDYVPDVRVNFFEFLAPANASAFPLVHVPDAGIEVKGVTLVVKRGR